MPVVMEVESGHYIKKLIMVSIIEREEDLFLCGLKTLRDWKAVVFYEANEGHRHLQQRTGGIAQGHQFRLLL